MVNELDSNLSLLRDQLTQQNSITQGVTAAKNQRIMALREEVVVLQRALYLHGKASNNSLLQARNALSKTKLYLLNIAELMVRCNALKSDLETYGPNLGDYGIQTSAIAAVISEIDALNEVQNSARIAILKRKSVTSEIEATERKLNSLLKEELDTLVLVYKRSNEAFYQAYYNARSVPQTNKPDNVRDGENNERDDGNLK